MVALSNAQFDPMTLTCEGDVEGRDRQKERR
jgi:hypothetical protein